MAEAGDQPADDDDGSFARDCPRCGWRLSAPVGGRESAQCPACGAGLPPPGAEMTEVAAAEAAAVADSPAYAHLASALPDTPADPHGDSADELDGLRIGQITALRRGAARARSYLAIGVAACVVAAVKLVAMTVEHVRASGWGLPPVGYVLFAVIVLVLSAYLGRRAAEVHREMQAPAPLPPPPAKLDLSTLSDGSQHWKNLEDIR